MVHPTNLLRSDSDGAHRFSAPVGTYINEIDCGITALPCLAKRLNLEKLAKLSVFVVVLSLMGCAHGIITAYFNGTVQLWTSHYNFPSFANGWLTVSNEIFVGVLAFCVSYWGNRIHRTTWMGALTMLIAISGATLAIPEIYKPFTGIEITSAFTGPALCRNHTEQQSSNFTILKEFDEVMFAYTLIFQLISGIFTVSFISHGLSYIDDHITPKHSPILLGMIMATYEIGKQGGIYFSWMPYVLQINGIFKSPIWIVVLVLTFLIGVCMAMFPKVLRDVLLQKSVDSLVSIASGGDPTQDDDVVDGYFKTLWKLLNNKILLLNILSFVLIEAALINFALFEKFVNQSKYHVSMEQDSSGYSDPSVIQLTTNLLRQPLVAVSLLTSGLVIARIRPKPKSLVIWNIIAFILVILIYSSTAFLNCTHGIQNEHKHSITIPFCSSRCGCPVGEPFQPVCVDGKTYFSPCLAGCKSLTSATMMYHNCSCGSVVTEGSCDEDNCKFILVLAQVNNSIINGIVASTFVVTVLIILRAVAKQNKASALGLQLTFLGFIPFVPVKFLYHYVTESFCEIQTDKGCQYFSEYFPMVVSIITIILEACAVLVSIALLFFINDLHLYGILITDDAELNNVHTRIINDISADNNDVEEIRAVGEQSSFIQQLNETLTRRNNSSISREARVRSYIDEGELVPPLLPVKGKTSSKFEGNKSEMSNINPNVNINSNEHVNQKSIVTKADISSRPNSRTSTKRSSKASGESDMSSLYRFADSLEVLEDNSSQTSSRSKIGTLPEENSVNQRKPVQEPRLAVHPSDIVETAF